MASGQRPAPRSQALARRSRSAGAPSRVKPAETGERPQDDGPCTRQNFDKRTSRFQNRNEFIAQIAESSFYAKVPDGRLPRSAVHIYIRKRPLFGYESQKGEYDVVKVDTAKARCVVHNCLMHPDMRRMFLQHTSFPSTQAFSELSQNADCYAKTAGPLLQQVCRGEGDVALLLMYGQTGSGKTFTMTALEEAASRDLFSAIRAPGTPGKSPKRPSAGQPPTVVVSVLEIAGRSGRDLLSPHRNEVSFVDMGDGGIQVHGIVEATPQSPEQLLSVFQEAKSRRATESTAINATSSRSHCITNILLVRQNMIVGKLTLVDCAGSERKEDSAHHTAQRRKEGAEINSSIYALKECMRAMASGATHIPFRNHLLTRALKDNFTTPGAQVAVIATCSPTATDTEHSIGTLRTVCSWRGVEDWITTKKEDVLSQEQRRRLVTGVEPAFQNLKANASQAAKAERVEARANDWMQKRKALMDQKNSVPSEGSNAKRPAASRPQPPSSSGASRPVSLAFNPIPRDEPLTPKGAGYRSPVAGSRVRRGSAAAANTRATASRDSTKASGGDFFGGMQGMAYKKADGVSHPKTWTHEQASKWVMDRVHRKLPAGTDGKALLRWSHAKCVTFCDKDEKAGLVMFNGLRLEVDHVAAVEKEKRQQILGRK
uniref:Kinesin motor domain-containing protein n=1 Tax=Eutreptiella gymnastica TaxID=73025 RepID=A0A7S1IFC2_9EUGL